jgi:putative FmdB family regulatory protein
MPIYAYRCDSCGHTADVLQKMSEAPLTVCPSCGSETFNKQLTAPAFQLKGSGWYVTDFRDNGKKPETKADAKTGETKPAEAKPAETNTADTKASAAPAATPAAAPAASPPAASGT